MGSLGAFPEPPEKKVLTLPGGASLTGMVDLPRGVSEDCRVSFNLMLQLGPFLGNLECLLRLLKFAGWVIDFVKTVPDVVSHPTGIAEELAKLPPIATDLMECVMAFTPLGICPPIKQMLELIRSYVQCLVDFVESIGEQQLNIGIQMGEAQGNPELMQVLQVAQENADKMGLQAMRSCEPAFGILQSMGSLLEIVGVGGIAVPSIDQLSGGEVADAVQPLKDVVELLGTIVDALPC